PLFEMNKLIGNVIFGYDNDSYMHETSVKELHCDLCQAKLRSKASKNFKLKVKKFDISYTYDGYLIVSKMLKEFLEGEVSIGVNFHRLVQEPEFFWLEVISEITFDWKMRRTKLLNQCPKCLVFEEVAGSTPAFVKDSDLLSSNKILRTDIEFGFKTSRFPLVILNLELLEKFKLLEISGLSLDKVYSSEE